jgi:hypothetical protein
VALSLCFKTGDLHDKMRARMTMCRAQNRKFSRCYTMQAVRPPILVGCPESFACVDAAARSCAVYHPSP